MGIRPGVDRAGNIDARTDTTARLVAQQLLDSGNIILGEIVNDPVASGTGPMPFPRRHILPTLVTGLWKIDVHVGHYPSPLLGCAVDQVDRSMNRRPQLSAISHCKVLLLCDAPLGRRRTTVHPSSSSCLKLAVQRSILGAFMSVADLGSLSRTRSKAQS
ncbi:hypothetical protein Swit_1240 [Rhizorhabdus wittichii RW1]|uniref:Uncharacterized protein n=1 Tax=Rhizorhabdus wittichii (strain DSM 6014 / CCUG 31198 / JCM 15750 / NBRC 105917 / EY 4224 / RW1) TaxID=392499 RepID=A0A9J9H9R8_RHIWR|nr:hypothetical protein Swit_1240 [Rhizorhabdus wittichii RW1]